jgi:creatinine amidohydrolase
VLSQEAVIETLTSVMVSLADMGFRKVAVISTHGNHDGVARVAAREVADERGIGPGLFFPHAAVGDVMKAHSKAGPGGTCHACEMETSLMLHIAPDLVDMSVATAADKLKSVPPYPSSQAFVSTWTRQESLSGTYGDPTVATAELGRLLFEKMVAETAGFIRYYHGVEQI